MRPHHGDHGHDDEYGAGAGGYGDQPYGGPVQPSARGAAQRGRSTPAGGRGVSDGLLVGFLVFLLGITLLVWTATGLAGLLAHGSWPTGVTFSQTPLAMRHLMGQPHDVAGAWPHTPKDQVSGYGLFWGLFIGQLMVLLVLLVFALGTVARWRARRALERRQGTAGRPGSLRRARRAAPSPSSSMDDVPLPAPRAAAGSGTQETVLLAKGVHDAGAAAPPVPGQGGPAGKVPFKEGPVQGAGQPIAEGPSTEATGVPARGAPAHTAVAAVPQAPSAAQETSLPSGGAPLLADGAPLRAEEAPGRPAQGLVLGPAGTRRPLAVRAVRDAEGPALVVTSDPAVWAETKDARAKLGPVLLYDPDHRCETPARLHWSPTAGCEDRGTAAERARALLAPVRPAARIDGAVADTAETLLRCFLHAAAVDGRQVRHVHRWAQGTQVQDAVRILRSHPRATSGTAGELEAALTAHPERRDIAQELTARALSALSSVHIRDACTPNRTDAVSLDSFAAEGGTLYVVGEAVEDPKSHPGAMPLLTALASSVVEHGRRMAERSSSGRLDPPLRLVLDDIAAVAPLPQLPGLLATGADRGMPTLALMRSQEQARARWPHDALPFQAPSGPDPDRV
ncbi:hypothetical protein GCM10018793_65190 [Streptomyces sulfonofaciens]|uniref:Type VI secretion protein n=1 Tax=Streptomyces sulfonofaciens TaxID=68272 RepID=A0A919GQ47_9ACTN|nr:type VI secretion protein [Streptomyces sulfonofaciens]GHH87840.1 hypothetical protein GCM10018793_65190 [Streptomyces sulfonofaciens]